MKDYPEFLHRQYIVHSSELWVCFFHLIQSVNEFTLNIDTL